MFFLFLYIVWKVFDFRIKERKIIGSCLVKLIGGLSLKVFFLVLGRYSFRVIRVWFLGGFWIY